MGRLGVYEGFGNAGCFGQHFLDFFGVFVADLFAHFAQRTFRFEPGQFLSLKVDTDQAHTASLVEYGLQRNRLGACFHPPVEKTSGGQGLKPRLPEIYLPEAPHLTNAHFFGEFFVMSFAKLVGFGFGNWVWID